MKRKPWCENITAYLYWSLCGGTCSIKRWWRVIYAHMRHQAECRCTCCNHTLFDATSL